MMKQLTLLALSVMLAGGAQAYTCSSSDGSLGTSDGQYNDGSIRTTGSLDCIGEVEGNDGPVKAAVSLGREIRAVQDVSLTFESSFSEAIWTNEFGWDGDVRFNSGKIGEEDPFTEVFTVTVLNGGLLPFFYIADVGGADFQLDNGSNQSAYEGQDPTFAFAWYEGYYYLGLNDNGIGDEQSEDFDVDDFVVRFKVNVPEVPEPASTALLALGMIGLGLSRIARRKV